MAREINAAEYDAEVIGSSVPVLLDVYGEHCGPCRQLAPVIEKPTESFATVLDSATTRSHNAAASQTPCRARSTMRMATVSRPPISTASRGSSGIPAG